MAAPRRIGAEDSATRSALLDAARDLMVEEGYAAVTSRRLAARAGLKPQLVHYYFRTMDDLFVALVRRGGEVNLARQARARDAEHPLRALWATASEPTGARLTMELSALANHREATRFELAGYAERFRALQAEAVAETVGDDGTVVGLSPEAVAMVLTAVAQVLAIEEALGVTAGHDEVRAFVDELLERAEGS